MCLKTMIGQQEIESSLLFLMPLIEWVDRAIIGLITISWKIPQVLVVFIPTVDSELSPEYSRPVLLYAMLFNANPFEQLARGNYVDKSVVVQTCDWSKVF